MPRSSLTESVIRPSRWASDWRTDFGSYEDGRKLSRHNSIQHGTAWRGVCTGTYTAGILMPLRCTIVRATPHVLGLFQWFRMASKSFHHGKDCRWSVLVDDARVGENAPPHAAATHQWLLCSYQEITVQRQITVQRRFTYALPIADKGSRWCFTFFFVRPSDTDNVILWLLCGWSIELYTIITGGNCGASVYGSWRRGISACTRMMGGGTWMCLKLHPSGIKWICGIANGPFLRKCCAINNSINLNKIVWRRIWTQGLWHEAGYWNHYSTDAWTTGTTPISSDSACLWRLITLCI